MEIVTLVLINFSRLGTAGNSAGAFSPTRQLQLLTEARDAQVPTLRNLVVQMAKEHGESGSLEELKYEPRPGSGKVVFNVQGNRTFYSEPYAACEAFPAIKSGGRYFRLEEVRTEGMLKMA